jgi:8-oxo-dGTP pyrophosphatase MutT (NUDIX family)
VSSPGGKRAAKAARPGVQYAALPYRQGADGLEVLLVTSRETRRWVIPKGWPMKGRKPHAAAAREAFEEAGVVGQVTKAAVGAYPYMKRLKNGALIPCLVRVYPLQVTQERAAWPEMAERERCWLGVEAAAEAVSEPELAELIRSFGAGG